MASFLVISSMLSAQDKNKDVFIEGLMEQMTLEEKIGQVSLFTTDWESTGPTIRDTYKKDIASGQCGALFNAHTVPFTRELQKIAVEETRLKIPLLFGYDVIHGYRTIFPIPLAESCSWDLDLIEETARIAAKEASSAGLHWTFAPMVDISRDPRWGRVMEGAGEDTWLGSRIAEARVKGFQGPDRIGQTDAVVSCLKHFVGYGASTAGRDYHYTEISALTMHELYLPPFKAGLDAGALTVMTAFNDINGMPATAHKPLLNDLLKQTWGFKGFVVTDYTSINELVEHGIAADERDAARMSLNAGVDMDMQGGLFQAHLANLIESKENTLDQLDDAVKRILSIKYDLGLFEDPYKFSDQTRYDSIILHTAHRKVAREMAQKSFVLLKNEHQLLPLSKENDQVILLGPLLDTQVDLMGAWSAAGEGEDCISIQKGIDDYLGGNKSLKVKKIGAFDNSMLSEDQINQALELASDTDIVILTMGENRDMSGEAASRANPVIPPSQTQLLSALKSKDKKVVVLLMNGRPLIMTEVDSLADAIIEMWWPGVEAGPAIAEVLYGDVNPSGKLTMTFPRSVGQIPIYYNERNTGRPHIPGIKWNTQFIDESNDPLYPFGYGLSYTSFDYDNLNVSCNPCLLEEPITVSVNLSNTGLYKGREVVQLYIRDKHGKTTRPAKELRGFETVELNPDETVMVKFELNKSDFLHLDMELREVFQAGDFEIMVGGHSQDVLSVNIVIEN